MPAGRPVMQWTFTYQDLCDLTGMSLNTVQTHRKRNNFDPDNLESVLVWLARNAKPELKARMFMYMTTTRGIEKPGERRRPRRPKVE